MDFIGIIYSNTDQGLLNGRRKVSMTAASPKLTPAWVTSPELSRSENLGI